MPTPAQRAAELRSEIDRHNRLYYTDAAPEISDRAFDKLLDELKALEAKHPKLVTLDSPQGPFAMTMTLTDVEGKVACDLTSDIMPAQKVTDISKAGNDLVLKYQGDFQGQAFAAKITLTPVEDKLGVNFDVMDGQFMMSGVGTKK